MVGWAFPGEGVRGWGLVPYSVYVCGRHVVRAALAHCSLAAGTTHHRPALNSSMISVMGRVSTDLSRSRQDDKRCRAAESQLAGSFAAHRCSPQSWC